MSVNNSFLRTTSNLNGDPIEDVLALYDSKTSGKKFNKQTRKSANGLIILIDSDCPLTFSQHVAIEPRLDEFRLTSPDLPSYLPSGCENTTSKDARTLTKTKALTVNGSEGFEYGSLENGS